MKLSISRSKALVALALAATVLSSQAQGQSATTQKKKTVVKHKVVRRTSKPVERKPAGPTTAEEIRALREQMQAQQTAISGLQQQLSASQQQVSTVQQSAADAQQQAVTAQSNAAAANQAAAQAQSNLDAMKGSVSQVQQQASSLQDTVIANQAATQEAINSPAVLHYKGVSITPVAFFAFEGVWRERSVNSDINTPFNSIPFPGSNEGHVSELNFSGRQSRLGVLVAGDAGKYKLSGYFEGDFLGTGTSSNNNQSNSYVFRQRQFWGQATRGGFTVTGGQMWSLVTENAKGTDARTEVLPQTIDPQYMVGFSWTRQPGIRAQYHWGDAKVGSTFAIAAEQAQITNFTAAGTGTPTNYFFAGNGQNGGLYNAAGNAALSGAITTYANNVSPDFIVKWGVDAPHFHGEIGGMARFFRDYLTPIASESNTTGTAAGTTTYTLVAGAHPVAADTTGGGGFASARYLSKFADFGLQAMAGTGLGRYGSAQLADATVRPDGSLEPIKNYHGLGSLIVHATPKMDIFAYYGGEYGQRTQYSNAFGQTWGYGTRNLNNTGCYAIPVEPTSNSGGAITPAANCASQTRYIEEGMLGFVYRFVNSPKYGRLQYSATYQYIQRNLWSGTGGVTATTLVSTPTGPRAEDSMIHMGMRYYIP